MIQTPEALRQSFERFLLDVTEPMDPLISLKLTQLMLGLVDTSYAMGYQDGQHQPVSGSCSYCPYSARLGG